MNIISGIISRTRSSSLIEKILLSFLFTGIYILSGKIRFYLPWTEVPITLQTTSVLFVPFFLGFFSLFSLFFYFFLGIIGFRVFSGDSSGFNYFIGPTGGYLIGFLFSTIILNKFLSKEENWNFKNMFFILLFIDIFFILLPGGIWYGFWRGDLNILLCLRNAVIPFIPGDFIKIIIPLSIFSHFARDVKD